MLPSRGDCHGVFLLSHAARVKERKSVDDWVQAARERSSFMARALRLEEIARGMLDFGLAIFTDRIALASSLDGLSESADAPTLRAIARLLLRAAPPSWIWFMVQDGHITKEYVPKSDLQRLTWIEPELDQMLIDAFGAIVIRHDDAFLKAMGNAAELMILAAIRRAGGNPLHVSSLSDAYGYDIECPGAKTERIEVKAASMATLSRFHISRNEFDKSSLYGPEWRLVLKTAHHGALQELVPKDTPSFQWTESAQISPTSHAWNLFEVALDPDFFTPGFRYTTPE